MSYWEGKEGPALYADRMTPVPLAESRCRIPIPGGGHACKLHTDHNGPHECTCGAEAANDPIGML